MILQCLKRVLILINLTLLIGYLDVQLANLLLSIPPLLSSGLSLLLLLLGGHIILLNERNESLSILRKCLSCLL